MKNTICLLLAALLMSACAVEKDYLVTIDTPYGAMHAVLYDATPKHKKNFLDLARAGRYDSTLFHRVIPEFMVQGGDLLTKPNPSADDSITYTVPAEFVDTLYHQKGALSAARQGDQINPEKASSGSQFYIVHGTTFTEAELLTDMNKLAAGVEQLVQFVDYTDVRDELVSLYESGNYEAYNERMLSLKPDVEEKLDIKVDRDYSDEKLQIYTTTGGTPHLDDTYTVFGQVLDGLAVIDSIAAQPTRRPDRPVEDIYMRVSVEEMPKKKITQRFGYTYPLN